MKIRTFICIEIPAPIKEKLTSLQNTLKSLGHGVSWTRTDGMHLTLKFLGDVDSTQIDIIADAVQRATIGMSPFFISIVGAGGFPNLHKPRVLWVGVEQRHGVVVEMQQKIEEELTKVGIPKEERKFSPHLTLGRVKIFQGVDGICNRLKELSFAEETFQVSEIVVMRSDLKSDGAVYTPLKTIELKS